MNQKGYSGHRRTGQALATFSVRVTIISTVEVMDYSAAYQTLLGIFIQESKHDIESGSSPSFQAVGVFVGITHVLGYGL